MAKKRGRRAPNSRDAAERRALKHGDGAEAADALAALDRAEGGVVRESVLTDRLDWELRVEDGALVERWEVHGA